MTPEQLAEGQAALIQAQRSLESARRDGWDAAKLPDGPARDALLESRTAWLYTTGAHLAGTRGQQRPVDRCTVILPGSGDEDVPARRCAHAAGHDGLHDFPLVELT